MISEVAEKSLVKLMQYLKEEEINLQNKIPQLQTQLEHNRNLQNLLLKIVALEEKQEEIKSEEKQAKEELASLQQKEIEEKQQEFLKQFNGKCIFKKRGDSDFCKKKTLKGSLYCSKHKRKLNGSK